MNAKIRASRVKSSGEDHHLTSLYVVEEDGSFASVVMSDEEVNQAILELQKTVAQREAESTTERRSDE